MKDQITAERVLLLHPAFIGFATSFIDALETATGLVWRVVQGFRSFPEQQAIYEQGRTRPGKIVTNAQEGESYHNYGLALDSVPFIEGSTTELNWNFVYSTIRNIAINNSMECGMDWPEPLTDIDHFENRFGYTWEQLLAKYNAKDFIPNTTFVNL